MGMYKNWLSLACGTIGVAALLMMGLAAKDSFIRPAKTMSRPTASASRPQAQAVATANPKADITDSSASRGRTLEAHPSRPHVAAKDDTWGDFGSSERTRALTERFSVAVAAIEEGGSHRTKDVFIAQSALTLLRAELYRTPRGQAKHRQLEARLDIALGDRQPTHDGGPL
jgi:hypothetical protein